MTTSTVLKQLSTLAIGTALIALGWGRAAQATTFTESGDVGQLINTAQAVNTQTGRTPINSITGTINSSLDIDLFQIFITGTELFSATTVSNQPGVTDTQLFLFDSNGLGVLANDDAGNTFRSTLPATSLAAGIYYLGLSSYDNDPISSGGLIFPNSPLTGILGPAGPGGGTPLSGWTASGGGIGDYTISLTGVAFVPEPASIPEPALITGLLGIGALGAGSARKRKK